MLKERISGESAASTWRVRLAMAVRPYIARELPGWGVLYRRLVGSFENDAMWSGQPERRIVGKLHGYRMSLRISGWSNRATFFLGRFYDLPTQLLIRETLRRGDTFVDIGANEGMMSLVAARAVGPSGKVIAFEPNPTPRSIFAEHITENDISHVEIHAAGASDARGELELFVPRVNSGEGSFARTEGFEGETVRCPVVVGDDVIGDRHVALIKIDVEGFEMHVLRGLARTIEASAPIIVMEMIETHLTRAGTSPAQIAALMSAHGYVGQRIGVKRSGLWQQLTRDPMPTVWCDGDYQWTRIKE